MTLAKECERMYITASMTGGTKCLICLKRFSSGRRERQLRWTREVWHSAICVSVTCISTSWPSTTWMSGTRISTNWPSTTWMSGTRISTNWPGIIRMLGTRVAGRTSTDASSIFNSVNSLTHSLKQTGNYQDSFLVVFLRFG